MIDRPRAGSLLSELVSIARTLRHAGQRSRERSLAGTTFGFLQHLRRGDARVGELAQNADVSMPVASRAVDALEADGLVTRGADPDDARATVIAITERGHAVLRRREEYVVGRFAEELRDWSDDEAAEAVAVLQRLNGHLCRVLTEASHTEKTTDDSPDHRNENTA